MISWISGLAAIPNLSNSADPLSINPGCTVKREAFADSRERRFIQCRHGRRLAASHGFLAETKSSRRRLRGDGWAERERRRHGPLTARLAENILRVKNRLWWNPITATAWRISADSGWETELRRFSLFARRWRKTQRCRWITTRAAFYPWCFNSARVYRAARAMFSARWTIRRCAAELWNVNGLTSSWLSVFDEIQNKAVKTKASSP